MGFSLSKLIGATDSGASAELQQAMDEINSLKSPSVQDLTYNLDRLVSQGALTPDQARAILMEKTAYSDIAVDPTLKNAQMEALNQLKEISDAGGLTIQDRAKLEEVVSRIGQEERGAREAIVQNQQAMGRGGTGMELAAKLIGQQGAATRASQTGTDIAALAEQRALEAIQQGGALAGNIRGQEFGEQAQIAEAKDALQRFNLENLRGVESQNVAARNAAKERNLSEAQRLADANVAAANKEREIRANAAQTQYENEMAKKSALAGLHQSKAQDIRERQKQKSGFTSGLIGAGGQIGATSLLASDERNKDIKGEEPDLDAFMESLNPKAFTYKKSGANAPAGENVGVIAQDVESTPVGRTMVKNTPDGKMLDMQKGFGVILAALAALHDKLEERG